MKESIFIDRVMLELVQRSQIEKSREYQKQNYFKNAEKVELAYIGAKIPIKQTISQLDSILKGQANRIIVKYSGKQRTKLLNGLRDFGALVKTELQRRSTYLKIGSLDESNKRNPGTKIALKEKWISIPAFIRCFHSLIDGSPPSAFLRRMCGIEWLIQSLRFINDLDGVKNSGLHELMCLAARGTIFNNKKRNLECLSEFWRDLEHKNLCFVDLRPLMESWKRSANITLEYAADSFEDDLAEIFRQSIGLETIIEKAGLHNKYISNKKLWEIWDGKGSYKKFRNKLVSQGKSDLQIRGIISEIRRERIGQVAWYRLYKWLREPLRLAKNGTIVALSIIGDPNSRYYICNIDLVDKNYIVFVNKAWNDQKHLDTIAGIFSKAIFRIGWPKKRHNSMQISLAEIKTSGRKKLRASANWRWHSGWDLDIYSLFRECVGRDFGKWKGDIPIMAKGKPFVHKKNGRLYGQWDNRRKPLSRTTLKKLESVVLGLKPIKCGVRYGPRKGVLWNRISRSNLVGLATNDMSIKIGIQDLPDEIEGLTSDVGEVFTDSNRRISLVLLNHVDMVSHFGAVLRGESWIKRYIDILKRYWMRLGLARGTESFVQYFVDGAWQYGLENVQLSKSNPTSTKVRSILADVNKHQSEWFLVDDFSLSNLSNITSEGWLLDHLNLYFNRKTKEFVLMGIQDKIFSKIKRSEAITETDYRIANDVRKLHNFMIGAWAELRSEPSSRMSSNLEWGGYQGIYNNLSENGRQKLDAISNVVRYYDRFGGLSINAIAVVRYAVIDFFAKPGKTRNLTAITTGISCWEPSLTSVSSVLEELPSMGKDYMEFVDIFDKILAVVVQRISENSTRPNLRLRNVWAHSGLAETGLPHAERIVELFDMAKAAIEDLEFQRSINNSLCDLNILDCGFYDILEELYGQLERLNHLRYRLCMDSSSATG